MAQQAEIRVVVKRKNQYAVVFFARLSGNDLYYGGKHNPVPPEIGPENPKELLRMTHHKDGTRWIRTPKVVKQKSNIPLDQIRGWYFLGGPSVDPLERLKWDHKPKGDSPIRRTLILDSTNLPASWSIELFVAGKDYEKDKTMDQQLRDRTESVILLDHLVIDWTIPKFLLILYTLKDETWKVLEESVAANRKNNE